MNVANLKDNWLRLPCKTAYRVTTGTSAVDKYVNEDFLYKLNLKKSGNTAMQYLLSEVGQMNFVFNEA